MRRRLISCIAALSATFTACGLAAQAKTLPELVAEAVDGYPWGSRGSFGENELLRKPTLSVSCSTAVRDFAGIPARITYVNYGSYVDKMVGVNNTDKLVGVLVEPIGKGEQALLLDENYPRLGIEDASLVYQGLVAALGDYFGPAEADDRGAEARHASWPCKSVSTDLSPKQIDRCKRLNAWLDLRVLDQGKADLRLWIMQADDVSEGGVYIANDYLDSWTRTPPETWSKHGALDVVWGMGNADVRDVFRKRIDPRLDTLELRRCAMDGNYQAPAIADMEVIDFVGLEKCVVQFGFFRGRLFSIHVMPKYDLAISDEKERAEYRKASNEAWVADIKNILTEKYGSAAEGAKRWQLYAWDLGHTQIHINQFFESGASMSYTDSSVLPEINRALGEESARGKERRERQKRERIKRF